MFGDKGFTQLLGWLLGLAFAGAAIPALLAYAKRSSKTVSRLSSSSSDAPPLSVSHEPGTPMGVVYLLKAGPFYKIGKASNFERRLSQIKLQLPYPVEVIHTVSTPNITGTETYWHRHFKSKRTNGEWFLLTDEDVAEFKGQQADFSVEAQTDQSIVSASVLAQVQSLVKSGQKIQAIKALREANPTLGLKEAKDYVDSL